MDGGKRTSDPPAHMASRIRVRYGGPGFRPPLAASQRVRCRREFNRRSHGGMESRRKNHPTELVRDSCWQQTWKSADRRAAPLPCDSVGARATELSAYHECNHQPGRERTASANKAVTAMAGSSAPTKVGGATKLILGSLSTHHSVQVRMPSAMANPSYDRKISTGSSCDAWRAG
jgi:hypothetical protein